MTNPDQYTVGSRLWHLAMGQKYDREWCLFGGNESNPKRKALLKKCREHYAEYDRLTREEFK